MLHIMKKIADWIVDQEKDEATDCSIPNEVIDEWLDTVKDRKKRMEKKGNTNTSQYEMMSDLLKKVENIKKIREKKCKAS